MVRLRGNQICDVTQIQNIVIIGALPVVPSLKNQVLNYQWRLLEVATNCDSLTHSLIHTLRHAVYITVQFIVTHSLTHTLRRAVYIMVQFIVTHSLIHTLRHAVYITVQFIVTHSLTHTLRHAVYIYIYRYNLL
jgi:hypothetical protein